MMSFQEIDRRRREAGLTRKAIYERAQVNGETWRRLADGRSLGTMKTLTKLAAALDQLQEGKGHGEH